MEPRLLPGVEEMEAMRSMLRPVTKKCKASRILWGIDCPPEVMRSMSSFSRSSSEKGSFGRKNEYARKVKTNNPFRGHDYDPHREPRSNCGYFDGDQLYGISSVQLAILNGKREIKELLVQEANIMPNKKDKLRAAELLKLAYEKGIKIREFCKHDLNMLVDNRDHQGFVLRVSPLHLKKIDALEKSETFQCVLALDEISDPQNFGTLLRTSYYLGVERVIIRSRNSAPVSPTVSSTSSGALEAITINRVESMMKFLEESQKNGWQVIGTSLEENSTELESVPLVAPTILVLGNEGSGVRPSVLQKCNYFVKVSGLQYGVSSEEASVDSLNVSVSGGIMMYHVLKGKVKVASTR